MNIKFLIDKLYRKFFIRTYNQKRKYLIKKGCSIGRDTRLICGIDSFGSEPYLISIGDNCLLSSNITLLTHDGGISVLNNLNMFEKKADKIGRIKIGDNVFVGHKSIIMPNVCIGDNVVIGCASVVTKDIPSNSVVCGIPARVIMGIDEYYKKNIENIHYTGEMSFEEKKDYFKNNIV